MTRLAAVTLSVIGIAGELLVLRHELVDCYPFKMMSYLPWEFYGRLGDPGALAVFVVLLPCLSLLASKRPILAPALMTAFAPLAYVALVAGLTLTRYGWTVPDGIRNFDGYTIGEATGEFAFAAVGLAIGGALIGATCGAVLAFMERRRVSRTGAAASGLRSGSSRPAAFRPTMDPRARRE